MGPIIPLIAFDGTYGGLKLDPGTHGNVIHNDIMKVFGAGTQLADNPNNAVLANATSNFNIANQSDLLLSEETYDLAGINLGDYEFQAVAQPAGTATGSAYNYGLRGNIDVVWANANATHTQSIVSSMEFTNIPDGNPPTSIALAKKMDLTVAGSGGAASDMTPANATIKLEGYNDLATSPATRQIANMGYQFLRVTKGEK